MYIKSLIRNKIHKPMNQTDVRIPDRDAQARLDGLLKGHSEAAAEVITRAVDWPRPPIMASSVNRVSRTTCMPLRSPRSSMT